MHRGLGMGRVLSMRPAGPEKLSRMVTSAKANKRELSNIKNGK
jgi:hypothetical protein